jgi:uncharacterized protein YcbX
LALGLAEVVGHLATLQRFPVEPLAGESPNTVLLRSGGLVGDRVHGLCVAQTGEMLTAEAAPTLLLYGARYTEDLVADELERWTRLRTPSGKEYAMGDPEWLAEVSRAVGRRVLLAPRSPADGPRLQLISRPTLRLAERTYGEPLEPPRLRANLVIEIPEGRAFDEDRWIGRRIRIGDALLEVSGVSTGCIEMVTRPGMAAGDVGLLAGLAQIHGGHLGVLARAVAGHRLRAGDPVVLVD